MNVRILFFSVLSFGLIAFASVCAVDSNLAARPTLYFDRSTLQPPNQQGLTFWSLEAADLQKQSEDVPKYQQGKTSEEINAVYKLIGDRTKNVRQKAKAIMTSVANRVNASAVFQYWGGDGDVAYINPAYDITREVIDELNKTYTPEKQLPFLSQNQKRFFRLKKC